jgi:hypothetical protein
MIAAWSAELPQVPISLAAERARVMDCRLVDRAVTCQCTTGGGRATQCVANGSNVRRSVLNRCVIVDASLRRLPQVWLIALLWLSLVLLPLATTRAAPPRLAGQKAFARKMLPLEQELVVAVDADNSPLRAGQVIDVWATTGKHFPQLEVATVQPGKQPNTFRGLTFKPTKGQPQRFSAQQLYRLKQADREYEIAVAPDGKTYVALDLHERNQRAEARIASRGDRLWLGETDEQTQAAMKYYEELFGKAREAYPQLNLVRHETTYFVVYTDLPLNQIGGYVANLDAMYQQLCVLFGVPADTNIWLGKCPVFAFTSYAAFEAFEAQFLGAQVTPGIAGLHHGFSDGRVVITCQRGDDPVHFAVVLVHETAHGFLHRVRSSCRVPLWLNEGLSDWVAGVTVPASQETAVRMQEALPILRQTGSLGGQFLVSDGQLTPWQYGVAATMVQFLLSTDPNAFRAMITAIKEGYDWEAALELTYGLKPDDLAMAYGRALGLPQLRP